MIGYKLFKLRNDGTIGSLFFNTKARLPTGKWLKAEALFRKGFAFRPGWHVLEKKSAPHLMKRGRTWKRVEIEGYTTVIRPKNHGGKWYLADRMKIL